MASVSWIRPYSERLAWLVGALGTALAVSVYVRLLVPLGHNIPSEHIMGGYMVALFWAIGVCAVLLCFPVSVQERRDLVLLWGIRCGVTLFAMLFYENNYGLDAYGYYQASLSKTFDWSSTGFGAGTDNTNAFSWLLNHYLPIVDSFHALKVVYSLVGFLACYIVYRGFVFLLGKPDRRLHFLIQLFPSIIFWSSTLGKDPIVLMGIALYIYGTLGFTKKGKLFYLLPTACGILIATLFRSWNFAILVLPLAALGIRWTGRPLLKILYLSGIGVAAILSLKLFAAQWQVESVSDLVTRTDSVSRAWAYGGSGMDLPRFDNPIAMLKFAPIGMFTALFRPLPGEVMNPFGLLAGIENSALLFFIIKSWRKIRANRKKLREAQTTWALTLIFVWSFIYGFVSSQNLGAAVRFKLQILPLMIALLFYLTTEEEPADVRNHGLH